MPRRRSSLDEPADVRYPLRDPRGRLGTTWACCCAIGSKTTRYRSWWAEALKAQRQLVDASPRKSSFRELLASLLNNQANLYKLQGRLDETERAHREARRDGTPARRFPSTARYQQQLATVLNNLANAIKSDRAAAARCATH